MYDFPVVSRRKFILNPVLSQLIVGIKSQNVVEINQFLMVK